MANTVPITIGFLLIIGAVAGYMIPISVTLADTTVNLTIPKVVAFCDSGFGQIGQMLAQVVMVCSEFKNFLMGIYGAGIGGVILIIVGAILPGEKKEDELEQDDTSLEILKERYAKGEISKEEFDNMKKDLENS